MTCFVRQLNDINRESNLGQVGGKALNLALMYNAGFPVPTALSVTVDAYNYFLHETGLREYGIPAVTAVKNATNILKTGQIVTIDSNQGHITIHPD